VIFSPMMNRQTVATPAAASNSDREQIELQTTAKTLQSVNEVPS